MLGIDPPHIPVSLALLRRSKWFYLQLDYWEHIRVGAGLALRPIMKIDDAPSWLLQWIVVQFLAVN